MYIYREDDTEGRFFCVVGKHDTKEPSDCVKNVILSEAKDLKWPKNEILRYTQKFARVTHTTINESIIVKYRSFAGQTNPARLRMTKMWGFHSNDKKREKCFFTLSDVPAVSLRRADTWVCCYPLPCTFKIFNNCLKHRPCDLFPIFIRRKLCLI